MNSNLKPPVSGLAPHKSGRTNVAALVTCYQLLLWLIPVLEGMPKRQKFQLGDRNQSCGQLLGYLGNQQQNRKVYVFVWIN